MFKNSMRSAPPLSLEDGRPGSRQSCLAEEHLTPRAASQQCWGGSWTVPRFWHFHSHVVTQLSCFLLHCVPNWGFLLGFELVPRTISWQFWSLKELEAPPGPAFQRPLWITAGSDDVLCGVLLRKVLWAYCRHSYPFGTPKQVSFGTLETLPSRALLWDRDAT